MGDIRRPRSEIIRLTREIVDLQLNGYSFDFCLVRLLVGSFWMDLRKVRGKNHGLLQPPAL